jgi:hypothetical protein
MLASEQEQKPYLLYRLKSFLRETVQNIPGNLRFSFCNLKKVFFLKIIQQHSRLLFYKFFTK